MNKIENEIIISIFNKLGIGVNAYVPKNKGVILNMIRKLIPDMEVKGTEHDGYFDVSINGEIIIQYSFDDSRVSNIEILNC